MCYHQSFPSAIHRRLRLIIRLIISLVVLFLFFILITIRIHIPVPTLIHREIIMSLILQSRAIAAILILYWLFLLLFLLWVSLRLHIMNILTRLHTDASIGLITTGIHASIALNPALITR